MKLAQGKGLQVIDQGAEDGEGEARVEEGTSAQSMAQGVERSGAAAVAGEEGAATFDNNPAARGMQDLTANQTAGVYERTVPQDVGLNPTTQPITRGKGKKIERKQRVGTLAASINSGAASAAIRGTQMDVYRDTSPVGSLQHGHTSVGKVAAPLSAVRRLSVGHSGASMGRVILSRIPGWCGLVALR